MTDVDHATPGNPVTGVGHSSTAEGDCLGVRVRLWCPGCSMLHGPVFRCPVHGGPVEGPVWDGDPWSSPFTMSPSLLIHGGPGVVCHSFVRAGRWEFLGDSTHHLAGQTVELVPLPDWLVREDWRP